MTQWAQSSTIKDHTMTETPNSEPSSNAEVRRQEIIAELESLTEEKAREKLAVKPYYHAIENEITKPHQGTFVTRYFRTRWRSALGFEASEIVIALRFSADKITGETYVGYDTLSELTGLSVRCIERWLSHNPPKNRSGKWLEQWRLLHTYFILGKIKRYPPTLVGNHIEHRRTTNKLLIAMDDPIHPGDKGQLFVLAAERLLEEEQKSLQNASIVPNRPVDGYGPAPYAVTVEKSSPNRPVDGYLAPTSGRSVSLSDRMNVVNVNHTRTRGASVKGRFANDPRVVALSPEERAKRERTADLINQTIKKLEGDYSPGPHRNAGFYRRAALLMNPSHIHEALRATQDAAQRVREGEPALPKGVGGYFGRAVLNIADREGIDLGMGKRGVAGQFEPLGEPGTGPEPRVSGQDAV